MKKKELIVCASLLSAFCLVSCNENELETTVEKEKTYESILSDKLVELTQEEVLSIAFDDNDLELSEQEALEYAECFNIEPETRGTSAPKGFKILGKEYIHDNAQTRSGQALSIPFYEIGFQRNADEGRVIVSGDRRSPGVVAYIEKVSEKEEEENVTGKKYMMQLAQLSTLHEVKQVLHYQDSLREKTLDKVAQELGVQKEEISYERIKNNILVEGATETRSTPLDRPATSIIAKSGPLTTVTWGQETPYNMYLPLMTIITGYHTTHYEDGTVILTKVDVEEAHQYAGCGVIAVAQALTYIKPTLTINGLAMNWTLLNKDASINYSPDFDDETASTYPQANMAARLVEYIYNEVDAYPTYDTPLYDISGFESVVKYPLVKATTTQPQPIKTFLESICTLNYKDGWDPDAIYSSALNKKVSLIVGEELGMNGTWAHMWIIDGYARCVKSAARIIVQQYDVYFHANMGWNGTDNGYYKVNKDTSLDFETNAGNFNSNFLTFSSITKK